MDVDVVIPSYNGAADLRACLMSLDACCTQSRVTVVDDASADGSAEMVRSEFPKVKLIARQVNGGFSAAVNDGVKCTDAEAVLVLNADVEVTTGLLDSLTEHLAVPEVFAVAPRVLLPLHENLDEGATSGVWRHGMFYPTQMEPVCRPASILYATACAALYRRTMLEELGGFDHAYSPAYYEDTDLGYRAWKRGWISVYESSGAVYHKHSTSTSKLDSHHLNAIKSRNSFLFVWRNIEDKEIRLWHRRWLGVVLARRMAAGDVDFVRGWRMAYQRRSEAAAALETDSKHRCISDREIFSRTAVQLQARHT